jgi:hypothetical protein
MMMNLPRRLVAEIEREMDTPEEEQRGFEKIKPDMKQAVMWCVQVCASILGLTMGGA